ncbi:MAG: hypothetical protein D3918_13760 [Candidatus Electrothrix sp. AX2]|nr:hypothetical protein [Candidatus Electrothrix gigas]
MILHRVCLAISVLVGLPIAGLGLLFVVPAAQDRSAAVVLLFIPALLVAWAVMLLVRLIRHGEFREGLHSRLLAFYTVAGAVSIWATTWDFSRQGATDRIFSPWITLEAALFFLFPLVHLLLFYKTSSAEAEDKKTPAAGRGKKCLRRLGQGLCILLLAAFALCCLVMYRVSRHSPYCDCASTCTVAEADANTILSDLADYFSLPARTSLGPTPIFIGPQACVRNSIPFSALRDRNTATISGDIDTLTISVRDVSGKCPKSYQEAFAGWDDGVFSKTVRTIESE